MMKKLGVNNVASLTQLALAAGVTSFQPENGEPKTGVKSFQPEDDEPEPDIESFHSENGAPKKKP
jgi:hypothetical protein